MSNKTKAPEAVTPSASRKGKLSHSIIAEPAETGQALPFLSSLVIGEDFAEDEHWTIHDLAEDAVSMFGERIREEFKDEVKEIAATADEADLEVLTRAFRHCLKVNGMDAAAPGRLLASILLELGVNDLGTGRREDTRRMLALVNAGKRLKAAGVAFVDDSKEEPLNASEGR